MDFLEPVSADVKYSECSSFRVLLTVAARRPGLRLTLWRILLEQASVRMESTHIHLCELTLTDGFSRPSERFPGLESVVIEATRYHMLSVLASKSSAIIGMVLCLLGYVEVSLIPASTDSVRGCHDRT